MHHPKHWPYVGYGHRVLPGEPYRKGCQLTEAQADLLLRKNLRKFCSLYKDYGKDSILLGALAYNIGPGAVNKSTIRASSNPAIATSTKPTVVTATTVANGTKDCTRED